MNLTVLLFVLAAVFAGALIPIQTGYNTQLAKALQSPLLSTTAVFFAGFVASVVITLVARPSWPAWAQVASAPLPSWVAGGFLGVGYIILLITLAPKLGAGALVAFVMLGQIACSALIDHYGLLGFAEHALNPQRLLGLALLAGGATLVRIY